LQATNYASNIVGVCPYGLRIKLNWPDLCAKTWGLKAGAIDHHATGYMGGLETPRSDS
jgi:hypothetical protein